jgi:hypothetical protein
VFVYRLALELGIPDPEEWKKRLTLRQLRRWMAYWRVEPFGDAWRMAARTSLTTAAGMGAKPDPGAEERFLPSYRDKPQTEEELRRELMKIPSFREQMQKGE